MRKRPRSVFRVGEPKASEAGRKGRLFSTWAEDPAVDTFRAAAARKAYADNPQKVRRLAMLRAAAIKIEEQGHGKVGSP